MSKCIWLVVVVLVCGGVGVVGCSKSGKQPPAAANSGKNSGVDEGPKLTTANDTPIATDEKPAMPATEAAPAADASSQKPAESPNETAAAADEPAPEEEVLLGTADLTKGVPCTGPLTNAELEKWLADPKNHAVLKPTLPMGLAAGAGQIAGLDENPLTRAKIELGRQLYFDTRLSNDNTVSCASCHAPEFGYAKDTQFGVGTKGQTGGRNSPVAYNRILSSVQFWDGRAATLEEQAKGPIANPIEMSNTHDVCVTCLGGIDGYKMQFERIFPDSVNIDNVAKAIASFERALVTGPSPWDYYEAYNAFRTTYKDDLEEPEALKADDPELYAQYEALKKASDEHPISESAIRGGSLFFSEKAGCTACHVGANFTDEKYHNLGVGMDKPEPDLGRFVVTKDEKEKGAFKTPTVRNVAATGPYMHDGSQKTLEEVVEWYDKGGHPNQWLDERIKPLKLTAEEKADLVAFMKALTGPLPEVEAGRLPE